MAIVVLGETDSWELVQGKSRRALEMSSVEYIRCVLWLLLLYLFNQALATIIQLIRILSCEDTNSRLLQRVNGEYPWRQTGEKKVDWDRTRHRYRVLLTCGEQEDENVQRSKPSTLYALEQICLPRKFGSYREILPLANRWPKCYTGKFPTDMMKADDSLRKKSKNLTSVCRYTCASKYRIA